MVIIKNVRSTKTDNDRSYFLLPLTETPRRDFGPFHAGHIGLTRGHGQNHLVEGLVAGDTSRLQSHVRDGEGMGGSEGECRRAFAVPTASSRWGFVKVPTGIVDISPRSLVFFGILYVYVIIHFKKRFKRPHGHRTNVPTLKAG